MKTVTQLKVGEHAPDITVLDVHNNPVNTASLWGNGPTLVSFLRHFGCIHCRSRLAQLEEAKETIQSAGLQSIAISLGEPKHAIRYCGKLAPSLTCLVSTENDAYYTYGLRQGTFSELMSHSFDIAKASAKAFAKGHIQGSATGDAHMLPGTFIVDKAGTIHYAYYSKYAGDDPAINDLVSIAKGLKL